jgi:hypothetical protein
VDVYVQIMTVVRTGGRGMVTGRGRTMRVRGAEKKKKRNRKRKRKRKRQKHPPKMRRDPTRRVGGWSGG